MVAPVDTDLNQHVKRHYMALETARLLQKMQDGAVVRDEQRRFLSNAVALTIPLNAATAAL